MLIVFEGIDGSGKSTVLAAVDERLRQQGKCVTRLKEPSAGPYGRLFRRISRSPITTDFANSLLIRDRIWDVTNNIRPALRRGKIVLLDRYYYSHVYQATDARDALALIDYNRKRFPLPSLTILFDVSPLVARRRIIASRTRVDALERHLQRTRTLYKHITIYPEVKRINATQGFDAVIKCVTDLILEVLQRRERAYG